MLDRNVNYWIIGDILNPKAGEERVVRLGGPELLREGEQEISCRITEVQEDFLRGVIQVDGAERAFRARKSYGGRRYGIFRLEPYVR